MVKTCGGIVGVFTVHHILLLTFLKNVENVVNVVVTIRGIVGVVVQRKYLQ